MQYPTPVFEIEEPAAATPPRPYRQLGVSSVAAALDLEIAITAAIDQFMAELSMQAPAAGPDPSKA